MSPHFAHYLEGRGLIFEYSVSLDYTPHKCVDAAKSHDDIPVATQRNSSNIGHVPREFSQVCWYFLQKSGSEIMCIVSGDRRRRETGWFESVSTPSGGNINADHSVH